MSERAGIIRLRRAERGDREAIRDLLEPFVERRKILPRTLEELDELLPSSFVALGNGHVVGFAALEIYSRKLAEIRGLVVSTECQGLGIGKQLVGACVELARARDVMEILAISSAEPFFRACGFAFTLPDEKKAFFLPTGSRH